MKGWKEYKIGDLLLLEYGKSLTNYRNGIGKYDVFGTNGKIGFADQFLYDEPSLIIGRKGAYREVHFATAPFFVIDTAFYTKKKNTSTDTTFMYYWFKNVDINAMDSGSAIPSTSRDEVYELDIFLPPLLEQKRIAEILSSLDDKIDLLHRQNRTLEQLAETLFRQWFEEEADESWEVGTVDDEFEFVMGQSPLGSTLNEKGEGVIFYQGRTDFGFRFPTPRIYTTAPIRMAKRLDTLISVRAPVGDMNIAYENCCLGRGVAAFRYKHNSNYYSYTYYKLRSLMQRIKQFEDNGSVFGSIGKDDFKKLENVIPSKELIERFQFKVKPLDDKVLLNTAQIKTLTRLRDTLLPKTMSGEVRVEEVQEEYLINH